MRLASTVDTLSQSYFVLPKLHRRNNCFYPIKILIFWFVKLLLAAQVFYFSIPFSHIDVWDNKAPCVTCCVRLHTLLHVVGCCCAKFETSQTFQPTTLNISFVLWSPKRSATMLDPFARFFQHCRGHARWLCMAYKDLWVVFFPRCTAGPKLVGSCCIRLHTTANTHPTTPNIVGATMLGVVATIYTQPNNLSFS